MFNFIPMAADAAATSSATSGGSSVMSMLVMFGPIVLLFVLMYFMMIRPQKNREKKTQEMRNALQVGDEITTTGGIVGRVVSMKEDTLVIETGSDRSKLRIKKWAIQTVDTVHDQSV